MRRLPFLLALSSCLGLSGLAACDSDPHPAGAVDAPSEPRGDSPGMRYACDGGYGVVIMGDAAQVSSPGGYEIQLQRVAGSAPPVFSGEAMEFAVESDGAVLNQDGGGLLPCREGD
ncbi:MAG: hypothetical protein H0W24_07545 [Lysobacter sp.]|nr:hypothetical protein [Lysobacter sp.]MDQ3268791.1 hypothetical protein [Pseudomonadota bacterium]